MTIKMDCFTFVEGDFKKVALHSDDGNPDKRIPSVLLVHFDSLPAAFDPLETEYGIYHDIEPFTNSTHFRAMILKKKVKLKNMEKPSRPDIDMTFAQFREWFPEADQARKHGSPSVDLYINVYVEIGD